MVVSIASELTEGARSQIVIIYNYSFSYLFLLLACVFSRNFLRGWTRFRKLNAASTAMSFEWPWQYNFPPFFT